MRTVYVDVLVTVNIFIDFILVMCTKQILHLSGKLIRMICAGIAGGVFSLAALLPEIPVVFNIAMDIVFAGVLVFIAFGKTDARSFLKRTAVFFSVSFSFCGIMVFVYTMFRPKGMEVYNDVVYFNISPFLLIILTLVCYYIIKLFNRFFKGKMAKPVCRVTIFCNGTAAEFRAMVDTGCDLKEPFSGEYVIIVEKKLLNELETSQHQRRIIPFNSLGGDGYLEGFRVERIIIDNTEISNSIYIGVCEHVINGDIGAIVPFEITKNL